MRCTVPTTYYTIQKLPAWQSAGMASWKYSWGLKMTACNMVLCPQQVEYMDLVIKAWKWESANTYNWSNPFGEFVLPNPTYLGSVCLEASRRGILFKFSTEIKAAAAPGHSRLLIPIDQQKKREITILAGVIELW